VAKRSTGVVRWFDGSKGYGYIDAEDGEGVFVHYSDISGKGPPLLLKGDHVAFLIKYSMVRGPQAFDVFRLN
jgi:CspA family cold shock protein